ncbi:MAG: hypothetical protein WBG02_06970 [Candidatus Acidiferrum sp.]
MFFFLFALPAAGQESHETLLSSDNAYNPEPSPDGRYIAYVRTGWGERAWIGFGRASLVSDVKIMDMSRASSSRTLAQDFFLSGWTTDGSRVVCFRDGRYELASVEGIVAMKGNIPNNRGLGPSFAEWVAYLSSPGSLIWSRQTSKSYRIIETPSQTVVKEKGFWDERVVPSPDGRYLAVFKQFSKTDLRIYNMQSAQWMDLGEVTIHPDKDWFYIQPNWSPWFADSSKLVFLIGSKLVISTPDGSSLTSVGIDGSAGLPVPSPDGKSIAYVTYEPRPRHIRPDLQFWGGTTIHVVSIAGGSTPHKITEKNEDEVLDLKWLDNETLVFDRVADEVFYGKARIWMVRVPHWK